MRAGFVLVFLISLLCIISYGCSGTAVNSTSQPAAGTLTSQLYEQGKAVYASNCAGCHGPSGRGNQAPAVWGSGAALQKYNNAQGLFNFVSTTMPFKSPGSLSAQQYQQVLIFLLVQNNYIQTGTAVDLNNLASITFKQ